MSFTRALAVALSVAPLGYAMGCRKGESSSAETVVAQQGGSKRDDWLRADDQKIKILGAFYGPWVDSVLKNDPSRTAHRIAFVCWKAYNESKIPQEIHWENKAIIDGAGRVFVALTGSPPQNVQPLDSSGTFYAQYFVPTGLDLTKPLAWGRVDNDANVAFRIGLLMHEIGSTNGNLTPEMQVLTGCVQEGSRP